MREEKRYHVKIIRRLNDPFQKRSIIIKNTDLCINFSSFRVRFKKFQSKNWNKQGCVYIYIFIIFHFSLFPRESIGFFDVQGNARGTQSQ